MPLPKFEGCGECMLAKLVCKADLTDAQIGKIEHLAIDVRDAKYWVQKEKVRLDSLPTTIPRSLSEDEVEQMVERVASKYAGFSVLSTIEGLSKAIFECGRCPRPVVTNIQY